MKAGQDINLFLFRLRTNTSFTARLCFVCIRQQNQHIKSDRQEDVAIRSAWQKEVESAASLDMENEMLIQDKTVMIIVHRMRTVAGADKIVVLSIWHLQL